MATINNVIKSTRKREHSSKNRKTPSGKIGYTPILKVKAITAVCHKAQANPGAPIYSEWDTSWYIPCTCFAFRLDAIRSHRGVFHHTSEEKRKVIDDFFSAKDSCLACKPEKPPTREACTCRQVVEYAKLISHRHPVPVFASLDMIYEAELEAAYVKSRCLYCLGNKEEKKEEAAQYRILEAKEGTK